MNLFEQEISNGIKASQEGESDLAVRHWQKAAEQAPQSGAPYFLIGSEYAANRDYVQAAKAMQTAVELQPDFWIARFQWGLLQLSGGDVPAASVIWQPLDALPAENCLRLFRDGLLLLSADQMAQAKSQLMVGIQNNVDNAPLNHDMGMVIQRIDVLLAEAASGAAPDTNSNLATFLASGYNTRH